MAAGILCLMAASFFHAELALLFFFGPGGEAQVTLLGFFLGGICGGFGVLLAAVGLVQQGGTNDAAVRLAPVVWLLICLVAIFFYSAFTSATTPKPQRLPAGESITI